METFESPVRRENDNTALQPKWNFLGAVQESGHFDIMLACSLRALLVASAASREALSTMQRHHSDQQTPTHLFVAYLCTCADTFSLFAQYTPNTVS